jgi:aspartate racemase
MSMDEMRQPKPLIGILGGMGPLATADFLTQFVRLTSAGRDQDHHRVAVYMDPTLPDRSASILGQGPSPLAGLTAGIAMLDRCEVDLIAIPCNTAHFWLSELQAITQTPIFSIVDAVLDDLRQQGLNAGRIGILGTLGTVKSGIYERGFAGTGFEAVFLEENETVLLLDPVVRAVKAGRIDQARPLLDYAIETLETRCVVAIVLGCTELPLATTSPISRRGTCLIDSTRALAAACVAWAEGSDLASAESFRSSMAA